MSPKAAEKETPIEFVNDVDGNSLLRQIGTFEANLKKVDPDKKGAVRTFDIEDANTPLRITYSTGLTLRDLDPVRNAHAKEDTYEVSGEIQHVHVEMGKGQVNRVDLNIFHEGNITIVELEHLTEVVEPRTGSFTLKSESIGILRIHEALGNVVSAEGNYQQVQTAFRDLEERLSEKTAATI